MVGDRGTPGAAVLGGETINLRQPSFLVPPTGREHLDGSWTVYEIAGFVHPHGFLFSGLFWDFGSLYQRRCGHLLRQRRQRNDVAASLKPAVAASLHLSKRCGVPQATSLQTLLRLLCQLLRQWQSATSKTMRRLVGQLLHARVICRFVEGCASCLHGYGGRMLFAECDCRLA